MAALFRHFFDNNEKKSVERGPDLSHCNLDVLEAILLRVPKETLISKCSLVNTMWNTVLDSRAFWLAKEEYDGEEYLRELLTHQNPFEDIRLNYGSLCVKKPFNRNLLADHNPEGDEITKHCDPRWRFPSKYLFRYTSPPSFFEFRFAPDFEPLFDGCYELSYQNASHIFQSSFSELGISDEILDEYRPPITFTEYVANRADCGSRYFLCASLSDEYGIIIDEKQEGNVFAQWEDQKWHKRSVTFSSYPAGVRHIRIETGGKDTQFWAGFYGPKIAGSSLVIGFESTPNLDVEDNISLD